MKEEITSEALREAVKHLRKTERGRKALSGLRGLFNQVYSLDDENTRALITLVHGAYGDYSGTARDAVEQTVPRQ